MKITLQAARAAKSTPSTLLVMKSLPVILYLAIAGVPVVLSAVRSMQTPYPFTGYSRVKARSTTKLISLPFGNYIIYKSNRLYLYLYFHLNLQFLYIFYSSLKTLLIPTLFNSGFNSIHCFMLLYSTSFPSGKVIIIDLYLCFVILLLSYGSMSLSLVYHLH